RFLTEINEKTQDAPQELLDDPEISKAISIVERGAYSDEQLATYDKYRDMAATEKALMDGSFNKGREEGEAIGLEKGKQEEKIDNARKMKECGVGINIISIVTGLSADEIEKL
ncbi:MAG: hypothetical protein IKP81_03035, partial [Paludibacteraceae bacterium]|nr:hypothetical protein [Paludibacteraceae bacterium]